VCQLHYHLSRAPLWLLITAYISARLTVMTATRPRTTSAGTTSAGTGTGIRTASRTARERARTELTREIKAEARRQLAIDGAPQLSLRAVARELGMASSAIYRYFPSRDELLTELIIDAYDSLGAHAERAERAVPRDDVRGRWRAACGAVRNWARAHPHEYALIYGSPVPGYQAPQATIAPAGRVALIIGGVLADSPSVALADHTAAAGTAADGTAAAGTASDHTAAAGTAAVSLRPALAEQVASVAAVIAPGVPEPVIARALIAWTQLFGMISFEQFGQLVGSVDPADYFFAFAVEQMADFVGLPAQA
jgi:AcrR family transcriptional regulator